MSEFKLQGDYYVSEWNGDSLNDGSDPDTPFAHPADAPASSIISVVVGSGVYKGLWSGTRMVIGDRLIVIDGLGNSFNPGSGYLLGVSYNDPGFKNIFWKRISEFLASSTAVRSHWFADCIFEECFSFNYVNNSNIRMGRCVLIDSFSSSKCFLDNSLILQDGQCIVARYCYFAKGNKLIYDGSEVDLNNNVINATVVINNTEYELKRLVDGSVRPDADPLISDLIDVFPNVYTQGNFAGDPKFIDVLNRLVEPDSDLLKRSNANDYIGGVRPASHIPVSTSDPYIEITATNIDTSNPTNWIIDQGDEGFITITYRTETITEVQAIFLDALLAFDGSEQGGTAGNNNVPDIFPSSYSPLSQPGLKPNRLTYELRTSQSISKPTSEAQWDNDNVTLGTTPGTFYVQEWNIKPTIHASMGNYFGNGNPESVGISGNGINARWRQVRVRLTNNRSYA